MRAATQNNRWFSTLASLFTLICVFHATAQVPSSPAVPENVPNGHVLLLKAAAQGVQIYECKTRADALQQLEWVFQAPEALLIDDQGQKIGRHYGGPTWDASDGSKVVGEVQQHADSSRPGAIPWLLLKAKSNEGTGKFDTVTYIQRVDTEGGKPVRNACDSQHIGAEPRVDYKANNYFYTAAHR